MFKLNTAFLFLYRGDNMKNINLKNIKAHTWVSLVMVILVIVNHVLTAMGKPVIDLPVEQIEYLVNMVLDIVVIGYAAWKNQSVTEKAQMADEVLYALRDGRITKEEVEEFIAIHKVTE